MAKSNKKPLLAPPASSSSSSSSSSPSSTSGDDSPPPSNFPVKQASAEFTVAALRKQVEPSSESIDHEKRYKDDRSLSKEGSSDGHSCDDSEAAVARSHHPLLIRESRNSGKQAANTSSSDLGDLGSEDGEEDDEEDDLSDLGSEDGEEDDYSSKSAQQQPPPPKASGSTARPNPAVPISVSDPVSEDEFENSSDSSPPRSSSPRVTDPALTPFSSMPMDNPVSDKRLATSSSLIPKKKKTSDIVGGDGDQSKKEISRRIWGKVEELSLLQCILDYKNKHHVIPSTQVQLNSLLKVLNDSLSSSVTLSQLNAKIRVLRRKHNNATKTVNCAKNPKVSDAHSAAVFDLMTKIWGSNNDSCVLESKIKPDRVSIKGIKEKVKPFAVEYPCLYWHLKSDHPNSALVFESHMPTAKANELEGNCKKLERAEIQLHMQKTKLLPSALKLIEDTLLE